MSSPPQMDVRHIQAITNAATTIVSQHLGIKVTAFKPFVSGKQFLSSDVSVVMGVNGTLEGQIICTMEEKTAFSIVGSMMGGIEINTLDDMGWSAIQEFGNWIAGKAASELSKEEENIDISPPIINEGQSRFRMENTFLTFPLDSAIGNLHLHVSVTPANS